MELDEMKVDAPMAAAMTITAASTLVDLWLRSNPSAAEHLKTGFRVAVEVIVAADPTLQISFIDPSDGIRYPQVPMKFPLAALDVAAR